MMDHFLLFVQYAEDGGNDEENVAELEAINHPPPPRAGGERAPEGELAMRGVDVEGDAAGGGSLITRRLYRKLSREQNDELEAAFQQNNFIDRVSSTFLTSKVCGFQSRVCRNSFE
jgi:hypothetical protein